MSIETRRSDTHRELYANIKVDGAMTSHASIFLREESPGAWQFNLAYCSKKDQFSREIGRKLARRRYFQFKESNISVVADRPMKQALAIARQIAP